MLQLLKISIRRKTVFKNVSISFFPSLIHGLKPNILNLKNKGDYVEIDASSLRDNAKKSIGENNEVITLEIKMLIENIELLTSQLKTVDKKIEELAARIDSPIFSIPGYKCQLKNSSFQHWLNSLNYTHH